VPRPLPAWPADGSAALHREIRRLLDESARELEQVRKLLGHESP